MNGRRILRLLPILVAVLLATLALGAPRFTWANEGAIIDHPWTHPTAAALGAVAAAVAAFLARPRALAPLAAAGALLLLALAAFQLRFRIEAVESGIQKRSLTGSVSFRWSELEAVEPRPDTITLRSRDRRTLSIATGRLAPEDRNRLERTIARRLKEASQ